MQVADIPYRRAIVETWDTSTPNVDQSVTDIDVFEHLMHGVPLSALLAVLNRFAAQSSELSSRGGALFKVSVEATAA